MAMRKSSEGRFLTGPMPEAAPPGRRARLAVLSIFAIAGAGFVAAGAFAGCGGSHDSKFQGTGTGTGSGSGGSGISITTLTGPDGGPAPAQFINGITAVGCDAGVNSACINPACPNGGSTSIVGTVYDPADVNPVYSVTVYIPSVPESQFPDLSTLGVQATADGGAPFCSCAGFFPPIVASAVTDAKGQFTIPNAPYGTLSIAVQTGKWRMVYPNLTIQPCKENDIPDKALRLPRNGTEGSLPEIAISTGGADSLECLPLRIGVDAAEYTSGSGGTGHVHIFQGFNGAATTGGSPASSAGLWNSDQSLEANDVVLLSCEGQETHNMSGANQQSMVDYTNNGGRAFLSHYHYAWLRTGPFANDNLATWQGSNQNAEQVDPRDLTGFPGDIDTGFYEGQQMAAWLANVNGLTPNPVATATSCPDCAAVSGALPIFYARNNVTMLNQPPTQEWIHLDPSVMQAPSATQYFSFDTPVGQSATAETAPCGRVVYSDLHVSGGPNATVPPSAMGGACTGTPPACYSADYPAGGAGFNNGMMGGTVPNGCRGFGDAPNSTTRELSPQEKALEFMLFDLSSCLVPVNMMPPSTPPR